MEVLFVCYDDCMNALRWKILQAASIILALIVIYDTIKTGQTDAGLGKPANVPIYVIKLLFVVGLVVTSIYFSIKAAQLKNK